MAERGDERSAVGAVTGSIMALGNYYGRAI